MLKSLTAYQVSVDLKDTDFSCFLLTPPTIEALAEIARSSKDTASDIIESLSLARTINLPGDGEDKADTTITVAGVELGTIRVETFTVYKQPVKRGPRKTEAVA